jgi:hypothetical protein
VTFTTKAAVISFSGVVLVATPASAESPFGAQTTSKVKGDVKGPRSESDGTYGRLDGDLDLGFGLGALVDLEHGEPGAALRASGHWFFMAGAYVSYADALGTALEPKRRLGVGIDLRPLFIPRWTQDWEQGPAILDLTLDSLSLGLGASFDQPHGETFGVRRAFEASFGFGVPLAGRGPGPWLEARAALAWPNTGERSETLLIVGSYHFAIGTPLVGGD